jgi:hypothetical protein
MAKLNFAGYKTRIKITIFRVVFHQNKGLMFFNVLNRVRTQAFIAVVIPAVFLNACKKEEDSKDIAITVSGDQVAGTPINFHVQKQLSNATWNFGDDEGATSGDVKTSHVYDKKGGYDVTVTGTYKGRDYKGNTWIYVTDNETKTARMYAGQLSSQRNWKHVYRYEPSGLQPIVNTNLNDTNFAYKMVDDSTLAYDIKLVKWNDSLIIYESVNKLPTSFMLKYNFLQNYMQFATTSTDLSGKREHTYTSY